MKAFIVDRYGSKDGVRAGDMPESELREDDVLVQIHAAGVNLLDAKIRDGEFKRFLPYRFPLILGNEVAGVVVRVGCGKVGVGGEQDRTVLIASGDQFKEMMSLPRREFSVSDLVNHEHTWRCSGEGVGEPDQDRQQCPVPQPDG